MSQPGVNKKQTDQELIRKFAKRYDIGYEAAWIVLSEDRRFLGAPTYKKAICHIAALRAVGSETTYLKEITQASHGGDPKGVDMLYEGYEKACTAAKVAVDKRSTTV